MTPFQEAMRDYHARRPVVTQSGAPGVLVQSRRRRRQRGWWVRVAWLVLIVLPVLAVVLAVHWR